MRSFELLFFIYEVELAEEFAVNNEKKNECILLSLPKPLTRQISPIAIK